MEYRIKDYTIKGQRILLPRQTSIEDLRLIFNETKKKLICSTATKDNVSLTQGEGGTLVEVPTSVCSLNSTDLLTIKCDYGESVDDIVGENKDATNSKILEEVQNKLTPLEAVLTELNNGKQEMVDALATKNVQSSTDKTLVEIASDVRSIAQSPITIDGGEMYKKYLGYSASKWDIPKEMNTILAKFPEYAGVVLLERNITKSVELKGGGIGDAYYTCDGVLVQEDMIGDNAYQYKEDFEHSNRWIAILLKSIHDYTIPITPNAVYVSGEVGTLTCNYKCNVYSLFGGRYRLIRTAVVNLPYTVVFENLKENSQPIYRGDNSVREVYFYGELKASNAGKGVLVQAPNFVSLEGVTEYDCSSLFHAGNGNGQSNITIVFPKGFVLKGENAGFLSSSYNCIIDGSDVKGTMMIKNLTRIEKGTVATANYTNQLSMGETEFLLPDLEYASGSLIRSDYNSAECSGVIRISAPKLKSGIMHFYAHSKNNKYPNLIDVEIGEGFNGTLNLGEWMAKNILTDENRKAEMLSNIHNHIAERVADNSGLSPLTATFSQGVRDILLPETEALFAAKNWNIAPAKTVTETTE